MKQKKESYSSNIRLSAGDTIIWGAMLVAIIVIFVISMINYSSAKSSTEKNFTTTLADRAEQCAGEIQHIFDKKFDMLSYLTTLPEINEMDPERQKAYLLANKESMGFESMFVMDSNGNGYYFEEDTVRDQSEEQFFKDIMENDQYITAPFYREVQKQSITTVCQAIYKDGVKVGILCGVIDIADLYGAVESMQGDYDVMVLASNGLYVASNDMNLVSQQKTYKVVYKNEPEMLEFLKKGLATSDTTVGEAMTNSGEAYVATTDVNYSHWKVCLIASKESAMENLQSVMNTQFMSIILLFFIVICIAFTYNNMLSRERAAFVDVKSGIGNRAKCSVEIGKIDENTNERYMLVNFNIFNYDNMKELLGLTAAERTLTTVGTALNKSFGNYGFVGRITGDNFIAIISGDVENIYNTAINELISLINEANTKENHKYEIILAYGYSIRNKCAGEGTGKHSSTVIDEAAEMMNQMKSSIG